MRQNQVEGVELTEVKKPGGYTASQGGYSPHGQAAAGGPRNTRTNSSLAAAFEELKGRMSLHKMADESRRTTRKTKGLDPNVPRPKEEGKDAH